MVPSGYTERERLSLNTGFPEKGVINGGEDFNAPVEIPLTYELSGLLEDSAVRPHVCGPPEFRRRPIPSAKGPNTLRSSQPH